MGDKQIKIYATAIFFITFFVYMLTAPRTIFLGDSAEFITAGKVLGIPHPPGYPAYLLLVKLFSLLPFGSLEWRISLLSALAASVGLVFLFLIFCKIAQAAFRHFVNQPADKEVIYGIGAFAALLLAFSDIFWAQAVFAKPYALNFMITCVLIWLLLRYWETGDTKILLYGAFIYGIGLGIHQLLALFIPIFSFGIFLTKKVIPDKQAVMAVILFLCGLAVYLYLPFRSAYHPALDWGNTSSGIGAFLDHVARVSYNDYGIWLPLKEKVLFFASFGLNAYTGFSALLLLALVGLVSLVKRSKRFLFVSAGITVCNVAGIILLRSISFTWEGAEYYSVYYLAAYGMIALWIGFGLLELAHQLGGRWIVGKIALGVIVCGVLIIGSGMSAQNYVRNNLSQFKFLDTYSRGVLLGLQPNAVLLFSQPGSAEDSLVFALKYQQAVQNLRSDVSVIAVPDIFPNSQAEALNDIYRKKDISDLRRSLIYFALTSTDYQNRPIYTTFPAEYLNQKENWKSVPNGLVYRLDYNNQVGDVPRVTLTLTDSDKRILEQSVFGNDLLTQYYYAQSALANRQQDKQDAEKYLLEGIGHDDDPAGTDTVALRANREQIVNKKVL